MNCLDWLVYGNEKSTSMNPKIKLPPDHSDHRGFIQVLLHEHNGSVVVIDTVPHVERANHYHKDDYHYCYVVSGSIIYYERKVGSNDPITKYVYKKGEMFYTPAMVEHCMYFEEPTTFVTMGGKTRSQEEYELDLVRLPSLHEEYNATFGNEK